MSRKEGKSTDDEQYPALHQRIEELQADAKSTFQSNAAIHDLLRHRGVQDTPLLCENTVWSYLNANEHGTLDTRFSPDGTGTGVEKALVHHTPRELLEYMIEHSQWISHGGEQPTLRHNLHYEASFDEEHRKVLLDICNDPSVVEKARSEDII